MRALVFSICVLCAAACYGQQQIVQQVVPPAQQQVLPPPPPAYDQGWRPSQEIGNLLSHSPNGVEEQSSNVQTHTIRPLPPPVLNPTGYGYSYGQSVYPYQPPVNYTPTYGQPVYHQPYQPYQPVYQPYQPVYQQYCQPTYCQPTYCQRYYCYPQPQPCRWLPWLTW